MRSEYSSRRVKIRRPPVVITAVEIAGGLMIVLLACLGALVNYEALVAICGELADALEVGSPILDDHLGVVYVAATATCVLFLVAAFVHAVAKGLRVVLSGLREIVFPYVPANVPRDFEDYDRVSRGLREQTLTIYEPLEAFAGGLFGKKAVFLSPVQRPVIQENGDRLKRRLLWFIVAAGLLALALWLPNWLTTEAADAFLIGVEDRSFYLSALESAARALRLPFVGLVILQGVLGGIEFLSGVVLVYPGSPSTVSNEGSEHYRGFGHPAHLFTRLPDLARPLELEGFANRVRTFWGEIASPAVGDTGRFDGYLIIEQQPRPIGAPGRSAAYLLLGAGWLLMLLGYCVLFFLLLPGQVRRLIVEGSTPFLFTPLFVIAVGAIGGQAVRGGLHFAGQARTLFEAARFRSLAILIECIGSLSQAEIRVGKSVVDSIESSNVMVRSDFTARFWAAELISEAPELDECRDLLALNPIPESQRWIDFFRHEIARLQEEGTQPLGVDVASETVAQIVGTNVSIADAVRLPRLSDADGGEAAAPLAGGVAVPLDSGDRKECPECAEMVRRRARRCRFCGYRFDEETPSPE